MTTYFWIRFLDFKVLKFFYSLKRKGNNMKTMKNFHSEGLQGRPDDLGLRNAQLMSV